MVSRSSVLLAICLCLPAAFGQVDYSAQSGWPSSCADTGYQSPVDVAKRSTYYEALSDLSYTSAGSAIATDLSNDETTLKGTFTGSPLPTVTGGPLGSPYTLTDYVIHWNSASTTAGSEHSIFGQKRAAEIQFNGYKTSLGSFNAASGQRDGLLGLSVFLDPTRSSDNSGVDSLFTAIEEIQVGSATGNTTTVPSHPPLSNFLPQSCYYYYQGSRTVPNCHDSVLWVIFEEALQISSDQFAKLQNVQKSDGSDFVPNIRNQQRLGNRPVRQNCDTSFQKYRVIGTPIKLPPLVFPNPFNKIFG